MTGAPRPEDLLAAMPYGGLVGIEVDAAAAEEVVGRLAWAPERCTAGGLLHGGALMSLADALGGICAFLNCPPGAGTATVSSATSFFRALREGTAHGVARPLQVGRRFVVVQTDIRDGAGRHLAQVTQTQAVLSGS